MEGKESEEGEKEEEEEKRDNRRGIGIVESKRG